MDRFFEWQHFITVMTLGHLKRMSIWQICQDGRDEQATIDKSTMGKMGLGAMGKMSTMGMIGLGAMGAGQLATAGTVVTLGIAPNPMCRHLLQTHIMRTHTCVHHCKLLSENTNTLQCNQTH